MCIASYCIVYDEHELTNKVCSHYRTKNVSTGVSQCLDIFRLVQTSWVCQCVQTIVTGGLRRARMIAPALITGKRPMTMLPACLIVAQETHFHNAVNLVKCLLMAKNYATECGGLHTVTPLTWITVQWWPLITAWRIQTTSSHSLGVAACQRWCTCWAQMSQQCWCICYLQWQPSMQITEYKCLL